ncbi:MAG: class I SAM-dependent methyltransferase family protein [Candidatus Altiarchaeota archaeon]
MLHLKVKKSEGEKTRKILIKKNALNKDKKILSKDNFLFFPLKKKVNISGEIVDIKAEKKEGRKKRIEDFLKGKISEDELKLIPRSFDLVGDIIILELNEKLKKKRKIIAEAFLNANKHAKTVLRKISKREGEFRIRKFEILAGENKTETIHKEYGSLIKIDVAKVYFSPREALERQRIASLVKENEKILVMFSGAAPFAIQIAKKQPKCSITCVDSNPKAIEYANENIRINKISDRVKNYCIDVREIQKKINEKFSRIVMPLPKGAHEFLDIAISLLEEGGILHFYHWAKEDDLFSEAENLIKEKAKKFKKNVKILDRRKVLPYAPRTWKIALDVCFSSETKHSQEMKRDSNQNKVEK